MGRVPDHDRGEDERREQDGDVGCGVAEPSPVAWRDEQVKAGAGEGEDGGVFGKECEAGAGAGAEPPSPGDAAAGRECVDEADRRAEQSEDERPVGQNPGAGGDTEHGGEAERERGPEARSFIRDGGGQAVHQPG